MSKLIDLATCKEFMLETLDKIDKKELIKIADALEVKSEFFIERLSQERLNSMTESDLKEILNKIFSTRRKLKLVFEKYSFDQLKAGIQELLYSNLTVDQRFQNFLEQFDQLDIYMRCDVASEILHYTNPDKYWLWNRWLWDPVANTGALPLVTNEEFNLKGRSYGEMYVNVGKAIAFVHSMAESAEFQFINRSLFGTDVYLSSVYVIYAYTIFKIKMTDEFNKVMPGLAEFSMRLLGIYNKKELTVM